MFWFFYWLVLLTAAIFAVYLCTDQISHEELDEYNQELRTRINQAELEYLRTKSTKSRIRNRPDFVNTRL